MTKGIEMEISDRNSPLSPQTLNAYIHNYRISPIADNLIIEWDNIQPFFECLWGAISKRRKQNHEHSLTIKISWRKV